MRGALILLTLVFLAIGYVGALSALTSHQIVFSPFATTCLVVPPDVPSAWMEDLGTRPLTGSPLTDAAVTWAILPAR